MTTEEQNRLNEILLKYKEGPTKEQQLESALWLDKFRLIYEWVQNREISLLEFRHFLNFLKRSN